VFEKNLRNLGVCKDCASAFSNELCKFEGYSFYSTFGIEVISEDRWVSKTKKCGSPIEKGLVDDTDQFVIEYSGSQEISKRYIVVFQFLQEAQKPLAVLEKPGN